MATIRLIGKGTTTEEALNAIANRIVDYILMGFFNDRQIRRIGIAVMRRLKRGEEIIIYGNNPNT